jgi:adsorption protein B
MTFSIALMQTGVRAYSGGRIYGWRFAAGVPVRTVWGNLVNFAATAAALWDFWDAKMQGRRLAWNKTDHVYPVSHPALAGNEISFQGIADAPASSSGGD